MIRRNNIILNLELFDCEWYINEYLNGAASEKEAAEHYLKQGWVIGYDPSPNFCTRAYLDRYEDVKKSDVNPLIHYKLYGKKENRIIEKSPYAILCRSKFFNRDWYVSTYFIDTIEEQESFNPILHYLQKGALEGLDPSPDFCTKAYLSINDDVKESGMNPLVHYELYGKAEKRVIERSHYATLCESELFDEKWYTEKYYSNIQNKDKADGAFNPILHYLQKGALEGLDASPDFCTKAYLSMYDDVKSAGINPLVHYELYGKAEKRVIERSHYETIAGSSFFDRQWYIRTYLSKRKETLEPDKNIKPKDPVLDYLKKGVKGKTNPGPFFSSKEYYNANPDIKDTGMNPLLHFELYGAKQGRDVISWEHMVEYSAPEIIYQSSSPSPRPATNSNIQIFVTCNNESYVPKNPLLRPIQTGVALTDKKIPDVLYDNTGDNISELNPYYCELTAQYWAWKNVEADYYGFFHNRRYMSFSKNDYATEDFQMFNFPNLSQDTIDALDLHEEPMREVIESYDIILPRPYSWRSYVRMGNSRSVRRQYMISDNHNVIDFDKALEVLKEMYPEYSDAAEKYSNATEGFYLNMYIMRKELFFGYCEWLFPLLNRLLDELPLENRDEQGRRAAGFIAERLFGIWFTYQLEKRPNLRIKLLPTAFFKNLNMPKTDHLTDKKDIKIFVSHRIDQDNIILDNPLLFPVRCGAVYDEREDMGIAGDNTGDNISERRWSFNELTVQYWAWKNQTADYFGLCHYRRYMSFSDEVFDVGRLEANNGCAVANFMSESNIMKFGLTEARMRNMIQSCDMLIIDPIDLNDFPPLKNNYDAMKNSPDYHNIRDMYKAVEIIKEKYPEIYPSAKKYMKGKTSWLYNCFIMKNEIFQQYSAWLFDILFTLEKQIDMSRYSMQMHRTPGTIGERLFGIYCQYLMDKTSYKIKTTQLVFFENTTRQEELTPAFDENAAVLVCNFNERYVPIFSTFLLSALRHFSSEHNYDMIVLTQDISDESKRIISNLIANYPNVSIRYYNPKKYLANVSLRIKHDVYSEELYFRLIVPYVLHNFKKALVLDVDMIVCRDLYDLYQEDVDDYYAAAVRDVVYHGFLNGLVKGTLHYTEKVMRLNDPYDYCNTGVILMNLQALRNRYTLQDVCNFIGANDFRIYEQDMLNVLCNGHMKHLNPGWNTYTYTNDFVKACANKSVFKSCLEYSEARKDPYIIHYAAHPKPWQAADGDFAYEFWEVARKSPYYERILALYPETQSNHVGHFAWENRTFINDINSRIARLSEGQE